MKSDILEFQSYKDILMDRLAKMEAKGANKSRLAKAAGCHPSFLSQVLNSHVHLTPDHAAGIVSYFGFSEMEEDYFMLLLDLERAGTENLRRRIRSKIRDLKTNQKDLSKVLKHEKISDDRNRATYYSSWLYPAIHIAVSIPEFKTELSLAKKFKLPDFVVRNCLNNLEKMGLLRNEEGQWQQEEKFLHLPQNSPLIGVHHSHWRQKAVQAMQYKQDSNLHYSVVVAVSEADLSRLHSMLVQFVDEAKQVIGPSKEESLACINLDLFRL